MSSYGDVVRLQLGVGFLLLAIAFKLGVYKYHKLIQHKSN